MKKMIFLIIVAVTCLPIFAQSNNICISVAMPRECILDNNTMTILKNKLLSMSASEGVSSMEIGALTMIPEISIINEYLVEGGMRNIYTIELGIVVSIKNIMTGTVFNSLTLYSKGEGYSKSNAMHSAINKIDESKFRNFVPEAKKKIIEFYRDNTNVLISKANTLSAQQQYSEAIALLSSYPETLTGYKLVSASIKKIYQQYLTQNCEEVMMAARAEYAKRNFDVAADLAATIIPNCSCFSDAKSLLASIKKNSDTAYNNELNERKETRNAAERVAKATIRAARDVAVAYYKSRTNYVFLW